MLYTNTLTRAETPTQSWSLARYWLGTAASALPSTAESRPFSSSATRGGVFSVKNTSAGDLLPSCSICCVSTSSSSLRTLTCTPVTFSKADTRASVVCSCCPLYSVIVWPDSESVVGVVAAEPGESGVDADPTDPDPVPLEHEASTIAATQVAANHTRCDLRLISQRPPVDP